MKPWHVEPQGRFEQQRIVSEALAGNPLDDPYERPLWVYLPPGYDDDPDRRYPSIYMLQGLTGQVDMWWSRSAFRATTPERIDELFAGDTTPPAIVVLVDAWTSLGGSQFLNSPGTGRYLDYLCDELVAFVDGRYRTLASREHRGVTGKSSGGYGAMVVPMLRPDVFGALASHAGDALFEMCYLPDLSVAVRALRDDYEGSFDRFWEDFRSRIAFTKPNDGTLLNAYCMAACYSAEPDGTVTLPVDPANGRMRDEVWQRWLELDPVRMVAHHAEELRSMRGIYLDAGKKDEYSLDIGAAAVSAELDEIGVEHTFELFDGGHGGIEYRYPIALRFLAERLTPPAAASSPAASDDGDG
jgi:S-formylglutathione hydrolase FrmB